MIPSSAFAGRRLLAVAVAVLCCGCAALEAQTLLVEDTFAGTAGASPDSSKFTWSGEIRLTGTGQVALSTNTSNTTTLSSKAGAVVAAGQSLVLQMQLQAYAEPAVYGDKQPRGLRVGGDANNAIEFYSHYGTTLGMRCRRNGVETAVTQSFPTGVNALNNYEIVVTPDAATFKVNGTVTGTIATNIPTGSLNFFVSTFDGYAGNVPVTIDGMSLTLNSPAPTLAGFSPAQGFAGTTLTITGGNFGHVTGVSVGGVACTDYVVDSAAQITAVVPAGATSGAVAVAYAGGTVASTAVFGVTPGELSYVSENGEVMLTGYNGPGGEVVLPANFHRQPVTAIGGEAWVDHWPGVTRVVIPTGVTRLADHAFDTALALQAVTIPDGVTSIGSCAFEHCLVLSEVVLPNSVVSLGGSAFFHSGLARITLSNNLSGIGWGTFEDCPLLRDITIPASVTSIGGRSFCRSGLESLVVPGTVVSVGDSAFAESRLAAVTLNEGITSIGALAFDQCPLTSVLIPESLVNIGTDAFRNCDQLGSIMVVPSNPAYRHSAGVLMDRDLTRIIHCPRAKTGSFVIPATVAVIEDGTFSWCDLSAITIPDGVTRIGGSAFIGCDNLVGLHLPDSITSVGSYAFAYCDKLADVTLGAGITAIEDETFAHCPLLVTLTVPAGVNRLGNRAFAWCPGMTQIYFEGDAPTTGTDVFAGDDLLTVYYHGDASGWEPTLAGRPTVAMVAPEIAGHPLDTTVDAMADVELRVTATGTAPLSYQWKKDGVEVDGATGETLALTNVQAAHAGVYSVVVANGFGSATSHDAVLTVNRLAQTIAFDPLSDKRIDDTPFALGATASSGLPVGYVSSNPAVAIVEGDRVTPAGVGETTITASQAGDGFYQAAADVSRTLVVTGVPAGIGASPQSLTVDALASATLEVAATGTPPFFYQWCKNDVALDGATSATLTLNPVQASDAGSYHVRVSNAYGTATSEAAVLTVNRLPQAITFGPLANKRSDDPPFALTAVAASGLPVVFHSSNPAVATVDGNVVTLHGHGQTSITASQAGDETYLAAPDVTQPLTVLGLPPTITRHPQNITCDATGNVTLTVAATGTEPFSYQWTKAGANVGTNSPTLTLNNVQDSDAGTYAVVVANEFGAATSNDAVLTVNRLAQSIVFEPLPNRYLGQTPFGITAEASSGLSVSFTSSNPAVATVAGNLVSIHAIGETTITASQGGNGFYQPAPVVARVLRVSPMPGAVAGWGSNNHGQVTPPDGMGGVTAAAAGLHHVLVLKQDGAVAAWGDNGSGQCDVPAGLTGVAGIAAGYFHSLAVKTDGTVVAWGYNSNGQATVPPGLAGVTAVAAGYYHSVALKSDGTVVAWGYNGDGQTNVPAGLNGVTAIAAGSGHTVALKNDGTVVAWGYNTSGQATVPAGLSGVTAVAAGAYHTLALKGDGTVVGWGSNSYGQRAIPAGLTNVAAVAAGYMHSMALKNDGTVAAWGSNSSGQTTVPAGLHGVTGVAAGGEFSLAVVPAVPTITVQPVAAAVNATGAVTLSVTAIGAGPFTYEWLKNGITTGVTEASMVIEDLRSHHAGSYIVVVGNAYGSTTSQPATLTVNLLAQTITFGELSDKRVDDAPFALTATASSGLAVSYVSSNTAVATVSGNMVTITGRGGTTITASRPADDIHAGASAARVLWVTGIPGTVVGWGNLTAPAGLNDATAVAAGGYHTLALKSNGTVVAWGSNSHGQLNVPAGLTGVKAIAAGMYHSVALKGDGTVVAWGNNNNGQCAVPGGLNGVRAIAAGDTHTITLRSDGVCQSWGQGNYGQLVTMDQVKAIAAGLLHTVVVRSNNSAERYGLYLSWGSANGSTSGAVAAAGGEAHSLILKADGTVVATGSNYYGQAAVPAGLAGVTAVAAGGRHSVALKADGSVVTWGHNGAGQTNIPAGLGRVGAIAAGYMHTVAVSVVDAPTLSSVTPGSGSVGASVTIMGSGFARATGVKFNGTAATFTITSDTELVATVPGRATSGALAVSNPTGTAVSAEPFVVMPTLVAEVSEAGLNAALAGQSNELVFGGDGTIELSATKIIAADVTLDGNGHAVTLSGANLRRVLEVNAGVHLTLRDLTVSNGAAVASGAGVSNNGGTFTAIDCVFTGNVATGAANGGAALGGAIYNQANGVVHLERCTFSNNRAVGGMGATGPQGSGQYGAGGTGYTGGMAYGGGIYNQGGVVTLTNCTFDGNQAKGGVGGTGGRGFDGYTYWVDVSWPGTDYQVTVYGGPGGRGGTGGSGSGGSIYNHSGAIHMTHVTLARGSAAGGDGGAGGAAGNYSSGSYGSGSAGTSNNGGNVANATGAATTAVNCIVAYGSATSGGNCSGVLTDSGHNLCSDGSAAFAGDGSVNNQDPLLGGLGLHGGTTPTLIAANGSPAIDAAEPSTAPATDQRGYARSGAPDMGASEFQTPQITGFTPAAGFDGTTVVITGSNFYEITAVRFGGTDAEFTWESPTRLTAIVPRYVVPGPVTVVSGEGTGTSSVDYVTVPAVGAAETQAPQLHVGAGHVTLTIPTSVPGRRYQLQWTESLDAGDWHNAGEARTGDGDPLDLTIPRDPDLSRCFYRVALE